MEDSAPVEDAHPLTRDLAAALEAVRESADLAESDQAPGVPAWEARVESEALAARDGPEGLEASAAQVVLAGPEGLGVLAASEVLVAPDAPEGSAELEALAAPEGLAGPAALVVLAASVARVVRAGRARA